MNDKTECSRHIGIDMGHRVPNHKSKCRNFHGHRYEIWAHCEGTVVTQEGVSDEGMLIDFSDIKKIMMEEIDAKFDHGFVMYSKDAYAKYFTDFQKGNYHSFYADKGEEPQKIIFVDFIPTAENLAKHWFELMEPRIQSIYGNELKLVSVEVHETPNGKVRYIKK